MEDFIRVNSAHRVLVYMCASGGFKNCSQVKTKSVHVRAMIKIKTSNVPYGKTAKHFHVSKGPAKY